MSDKEVTISFFLQDLDGGGAERAIVLLAGELARQGHAVDLVVGYANTDYLQEVSDQVNLIDFGSRSAIVVFSRLVIYLLIRQPLACMSALDPANLMLILASRLTRFKGRKVVSQRAVLDASLRDLGRMRKWVTRRLMASCFPRADAVISNSHAAARELSLCLGIPSEKIFTIQNAVDVSRIVRLAGEPLESATVLDKTIPLLVSVGSLTKRKDVGTLIRSFHLVVSRCPAQLVIVGKGPERPALESLIEELGLGASAHFAGFDDNPYRWIAAASVFISASTAEGFPNVVAEALALGCPVVATDCPGDTAELMGHGRWGRLVPVGDAVSMAAAILDTLDDPSRPMGFIGASELSPSKNAAAYLDVLLPVRGGLASEHVGGS